MDSNIYVLNTEGTIQVEGKPATHVYVIAASFEDALSVCRSTYPEAKIQGMRRMNSYNGLPVISAPGTAKSWGLL